MDKILRILDGHSQAEAAARCDDHSLTCQQRFEAFMQIMKPYDAASPRLQRIYRVDDRRQRSVCDDWGYAYNLYRNPRATGDIDFLVASTLDNEHRLREALQSFGFGETLPPSNSRLLDKDKVIMLGRAGGQLARTQHGRS